MEQKYHVYVFNEKHLSAVCGKSSSVLLQAMAAVISVWVRCSDAPIKVPSSAGTRLRWQFLPAACGLLRHLWTVGVRAGTSNLQGSG